MTPLFLSPTAGRSRAPVNAASALLLCFLSQTSLQAQTLPDAGSLLRESAHTLQAPRSTEPRAGAAVAQPVAVDAQALQVTVTRFVVEGAHLIPVDDLQALIADRIGQALTLAELQQTAQRIAEHYRQRGWYARADLPPQDITAGAVRIQVQEGHYSGSTLQPATNLRADAQSVQHVITQRLQPGQPLSAADLERGLLLANDLPGVSASGLLMAGKKQGETQLSVTVSDKPWVSGDVGVNNYGSQSTGVAQVVGGVALNNLSGHGDQLALRMLAGPDIASAMLRYSLPLGHDGVRLAAHASTLDYRLGGRYTSLHAQGAAHTGGLVLSYAWVRQSQRNLSLSAGYEHRRYNDDMLEQPLRRQRVNALTLGVAGDLRDGWGSGGITWGSAQVTHGQLGIQDIGQERAQDAAGPRSMGGYTKLALEMARLQRLGDGWQLQANWSGQLASGNLGSSERLTLGGPNQVRAYPVNEGSGDQGMLLQLELQRDLGHGWQALAFYDAGRIAQHRHAWVGWQGGTGQSNYYNLAGAGLGVNWRHQGWLLSASVATPLGHHGGANAQGRNSDGSSAKSTRGWINLRRVF